MPSKLSQQGELLIDHRNSPGLTPEWAMVNGVGGPIVQAGRTYETGIKMCAHCGGQVMMNPMRTREREWCMICDAYLCDNCGLNKKLGVPHKSFRQVLGELFEATQRGVTEI